MIHSEQPQDLIQTAHTAPSVFTAEKIHDSQLSKLSQMTGCQVTPDACQPHAQMCHFQMVQVIPRPAPWCSDNGSSMGSSSIPHTPIQTSSGCVYEWSFIIQSAKNRWALHTSSGHQGVAGTLITPMEESQAWAPLLWETAWACAEESSCFVCIKD